MAIKTVKFKSRITQIICQRIPDGRAAKLEAGQQALLGQFVAWHHQFTLANLRRARKQAVNGNNVIALTPLHHVPCNQLSTHDSRTFAAVNPTAWNTLPDPVRNLNVTETVLQDLFVHSKSRKTKGTATTPRNNRTMCPPGS